MLFSIGHHLHRNQMFFLPIIRRERQMDGESEESGATQQGKYEAGGTILRAAITANKFMPECPNSTPHFATLVIIKTVRYTVLKLSCNSNNNAIWYVASSCALPACTQRTQRLHRALLLSIDTIYHMTDTAVTQAELHHASSRENSPPLKASLSSKSPSFEKNNP